MAAALLSWLQYLYKLSFSCILSIFETDALRKLGLGTPRTPRFILDIHHPWITSNRSLLYKINIQDVVGNGDPSIRSIIPSIPDDLFTRLRIDSESWPRGWYAAGLRLRELLDCPVALEACEALCIDMSYNNRPLSFLRESKIPPREVTRRFIGVLSSMPNLQSVEWVRPSFDPAAAKEFGSHLIESGVCLSGIKRLSVGPNLCSLVNLCPHIESLELNLGRVSMWDGSRESRSARSHIVQSTKNVPKLREFSMEARWNVELLQVVLQRVPQVESLVVKGTMRDPIYYNGAFNRKIQSPGEKLEVSPRYISK